MKNETHAIEFEQLWRQTERNHLMNEMRKYDDAVQIIKAAILQSQYDAARAVNEKQLMLYYGVGKYISLNSRQGF